MTDKKVILLWTETDKWQKEEANRLHKAEQ